MAEENRGGVFGVLHRENSMNKKNTTWQDIFDYIEAHEVDTADNVLVLDEQGELQPCNLLTFTRDLGLDDVAEGAVLCLNNSENAF